MATISIIRVENPAEKEKISAHILHALPDWFGLPDSTQKYIDDSRNMPLFAAYAFISTPASGLVISAV